MKTFDRLAIRQAAARRRFGLQCALAACLSATPTISFAASTYWIGTTGNWSDPANWSNDVPGNIATTAYVNNGGDAQLLGDVVDIQNLNIGLHGVMGNSSGLVENQGDMTIKNLSVGFDHTGELRLLNNSVSVTTNASIGYSGRIRQIGGTSTLTGVLQIGSPATSATPDVADSTYVLSGGTLKLGTFGGAPYIEMDGGHFLQIGGTISLASSATCALYVGDASTYQMTGGKTTLTSEFIDGNGVFAQSAGSHTATAITVYSGSYALTGGTVNTATLAIQFGGTFTHAGATLTATTLSTDSYSTFTQSGGSITAKTLQNAGVLTQTAGSNSSDVIISPAGSQMALGGGTLQSKYGLALEGNFNFAAAATLNVGGIGNLTSANFTNAAMNGAVTVLPNSLLILPAGMDPNTRFSAFTNNGIVHNAGTSFAIPAGASVVGTGTIADSVTVAGTLTAAPADSGGINLLGGVVVPSGGAADLGKTGALTINDALSAVTGGSLKANSLTIGSTSAGTLTVSAGTVAIGNDLRLGVGAPGSLNVSGTGAVSLSYPFATMAVGGVSSGTVVQNGGTITLPNISVGGNAGVSSTYQLHGGSLASNYAFGILTVGGVGNGSFLQDGGVNSFPTISISSTQGVASYTFVDGTLTPGSVSVGSGSGATAGTGHFVQNGGTISMPFGASSGVTVGGTAASTYELKAGTMAMDPITINNGAFIQSGGIVNHTPFGTDVKINNGTYEMSAGSAVLDVVSFASSGGIAKLLQTGGDYSARTETIASDGVAPSSASLIVSGGTHIAQTIQIGTRGSLTYSGGTISSSFIFSMSGAASALNFSFDPADPLDPIAVFSCSLAGKLGIDLFDGAVQPGPSDLFVLIKGSGTLSGQFTNAPNGSRISTDGGTFVVNYGSQSAFSPSQLVLSNFQVPEPTSLSVFLPLAASLAMKRRRRR